VKCCWCKCFGAADDLIFLSSKVLDPSFEFHFAEKTRNKLKLQNEKLFLHFLWTGGALVGTEESNLG
jgi:hypothetical protein